MFEFSVVIKDEFALGAKKFYEELKNTVNSFGALVTSFSERNEIHIIIACEDIEKPRITYFIQDAISNFIVEEYKQKFIKENLKISLKNQLNLNALIKAMVAFDKETDKYIASRSLILKDNLVMESFYNFKLKKLRAKWMELIKLTNENSGYLLCNDTFIDLLKFLIENIEITKELVNVVYDGKNYKICDENFKEIEKSSKDLSDSDGAEALLVTSLIELAPKKINVYCELEEDSDVLTLISQIFDRRVNILPNCLI